MVVAVKDIYNLALSNLGTRSRVTATDDGSREANKLNVVYADVRDELLQQHPWNFAGTREALAAQAVATAPDDWSYVYAQPADCLALRFLATPGAPPDRYDGLEPVRYEVRVVKDDTLPVAVRKMAILTDLGNAVACYTWAVTDPDFMPPHFRIAFGWKLAGAVALALTGSDSTARACFNMFTAQLDIARVIDARQGQSRVHDQPAAWTAARG